MTISSEVTHKVFPRLKRDDPKSDKRPAEYETREEAALLWNDPENDFAKRVLIVDIMSFFYQIEDEVCTWRALINKCASYIAYKTIDINPQVIIVCVDKLIKNEAREFVRQNRRSSTISIPLNLPQVPGPPSAINIDNPADFPYPGVPIKITSREAYSSGMEWRAQYLYPQLKEHLGYFLPKFTVIMSGFDADGVALRKIPDVGTLNHIPVEGDFQCISWSMLCLEKNCQVFIDSFDGDMFPASMTAIDVLVALNKAAAIHPNQWWWIRSVKKNIGHVNLVQAYHCLCTPLFNVGEMNWPGVLISLLCYMCGNDYVNVLSESRVTGINLDVILDNLATTQGIDQCVYLTVDSLGRVVFEIDHNILVPLLQKAISSRKTASLQHLIALCRQMAFCASYFAIEPLTAFKPHCESPSMTRLINGLPYYSYQRIHQNAEISFNTNVPLNEIPKFNPKASMERLGQMVEINENGKRRQEPTLEETLKRSKLESLSPIYHSLKNRTDVLLNDFIHDLLIQDHIEKIFCIDELMPFSFIAVQTTTTIVQ